MSKTTYLCIASCGYPEFIRHASKASAIESFREQAAELARYDQKLEASLHYASRKSEIAEYPDHILELGPRGGVKVINT